MFSSVETRKYDDSPSRTLQRRRAIIMKQLAKEYMMENPESIHRTSVASDISDNRIQELKADLEALEEE